MSKLIPVRIFLLLPKAFLLQMTSVLLIISVSAQIKTPARAKSARLQTERTALQRQIGEIKRSLDETRHRQQETRGQLVLLQGRLAVRQTSIQQIGTRIHTIRHYIDGSETEIGKLNGELGILREEYRQGLVFAYKNRDKYDLLNFVFSAGNFYDVVRRIEFLRYYQVYREEKATDIRHKAALLEGKVRGLESARLEKDAVLQQQAREEQMLEQEQRQQKIFALRLRLHEKDLVREMAVRQRQDSKLARGITAVLAHHVPVAAKKPAVSDAGRITYPSPVLNIESVSLERRRGYLPWPVDSRTISMHFGLQAYMNNLKYDNLGITIDVEGGAMVRSVCDGEVQSIIDIDDAAAVVVRSGKYLFIYSNIAEVSVTKGNPVTTGQVLGHMAGPGQLEFRICDGKDSYFDPEKWLKR